VGLLSREGSRVLHLTTIKDTAKKMKTKAQRPLAEGAKRSVNAPSPSSHGQGKKVFE